MCVTFEIIVLFAAVKKRSIRSNIYEGVAHLRRFVENISNSPNNLNNCEYITSHLTRHSDAMFEYFKYAKEFVEMHVDNLNQYIEDLTWKLSCEEEKLNNLKIELKRKEKAISHKKNELEMLKQQVESSRVTLANARSIVREQEKKYKEAKKARDASEAGMFAFAFIPFVNLIAVPIAYAFYDQYGEDIKTYRENMREAEKNLDVHRNDLQRKKQDVKNCQKERERAAREQKNLEEQSRQTNQDLEDKKSEMKEKNRNPDPYEKSFSFRYSNNW